MTHEPPGTLRVLWLLAGSACRRLLRAQKVVAAIRSERRGTTKRRATAKRARGAGIVLLFLLFLPLMGLNALSQAAGGVSRLARGIEQAVATAAAAESGREPRFGGRTRRDAFELLTPVRHGDAPVVRDGLASGGTLLLTLLVLLLVFASIGSANWELGRAAWAFPWLLTFPVPTRAIVLAKIGEYTLVQLLPWFTVFPLSWQLLRGVGWQGPAFLLAIAMTFSATALVGSLRFLLETWLRLRVSLQTVRSVQGTCSLLGVACFGLLFSVVMTRETPRWFIDAAAIAAPFTRWLPTGWPVALGRGDPLAAAVGAGVLLLAVVAMTAVCVRLLEAGYERSGGVDSGRRRARAATRAPAVRALGRLGIVKKDLLLLVRDRNFLVQTVGVPIFVLGMQLFLPTAGTGPSEAKGQMAPMLVYFASLAALSTGCFMVLSSEGRALWLLYAQPVALATQLRRKVYLWAGLAMALAIGAFTLWTGDQFAITPWRWSFDLFCVAAGVFGAAWLAAGIGTLGTDPAADQVPRTPKARHVYLFLYLAGSYVVGLASQDLAVRAAALLVFGTLAWALWQRIGDRLPWLLDPHGRQPATLTAYDAGAAVTTFALLNALLTALLWQASSQVLVHAIAFAIAGAGTLMGFGLLLIARGLSLAEVFGMHSVSVRRGTAWTLVGVAAGAALGWLGLQWLHEAHARNWIEAEALRRSVGADRVMLLLLTVGMAPVIEELLFRGLLFQALRRSVPMWLAAVWSALLFTVLHPTIAWPPVFLVGCAAALLAAWSRFLPACMALHATYNWIVVGMG